MHTLLLIPFFLGGGFLFDTNGKWEHPSPGGNGDSRKSHRPAAPGMEPGRTRSQPWWVPGEAQGAVSTLLVIIPLSGEY